MRTLSFLALISLATAAPDLSPILELGEEGEGNATAATTWQEIANGDDE